jgi:hypothetical protein
VWASQAHSEPFGLDINCLLFVGVAFTDFFLAQAFGYL